MNLKFKSGGQVSDSVGLLVSILVRYPEVGTINVDEAEQLLKFKFFLTKEASDLEQYCEQLKTSLQLFNQLEGRTCRVCSLDFRQEDGVVVFEVKRDIETVTQNELNLLVDLFRQYFFDTLVSDQGEEVPEEELLMQDELIRHMLENLRTNRLDKSVLALREEGRVLVFNK